MGEKGREKSKSQSNRSCTKFAEAELPRITADFHYFLKEHDSSYLKKMEVIVSYTTPGDYFKIRILPVNGVDSQQYFKDNFETESVKSELEKFAEENCIGAFVYGVEDLRPKETERFPCRK